MFKGNRKGMLNNVVYGSRIRQGRKTEIWNGTAGGWIEIDSETLEIISDEQAVQDRKDAAAKKAERS